VLTPGRWYVIGADASCDIVVDAGQVSGRHAQICVDEGSFVIEDLGSRNGVFVQAERVRRASVRLDDVVGLGSHRASVRDLLQRVGSFEYEVRDGMTTIGRDPANTIVIDSSAVSARHARVFVSAGRLILEDLGSRNGTLVRAAGQTEWVTYRHCILRRGDVVRVGGRELRFRMAASERRPGARLDVQDVRYTVKDRETGAPLDLLAGVSFTALDGELIGILGPSGSGKTSLLNVLAGYQRPTSGRVLLQGQDLHAAEGTIRLVGHAPQFDVVHSTLTVREAVYYSARLRGPAEWSEAELNERVSRAISQVGLTKKADIPLGSDVEKTLSGGQKKRVNIAMELVLDGPVLILDEPTSGLSAHDTLELMTFLRSLASRGRTVVLTIHQPSYAAFVLMDQVVLLEEGGHLAWFGPAALDVFEFLGVTDREPGALLEQMEAKKDPSAPSPLVARYAATETKRRLVDGRAAEVSNSSIAAWPTPVIPSAAHHAVALLARNLRMKRRDAFFLTLTLVVPALVAVLFVSVLGAQLQDGQRTALDATVEHQYLVVLTIMTCLFGALSAALEVVSELPIVARENRGGVGIPAYVASKALMFGLPSMVFPGVAVFTTHLLAGDVMGGDATWQWLVLAATFFAASCGGLFLSSLVTSPPTVVVLAVFYAIVQVVFSVFVPLRVTYEEPARARWLQVVSAPVTARWTLRGLVSTSDLCALPVADAPEAAPEVFVFVRDCQRQMYQNHGIARADTPDDRLAAEHRSKAIGANLTLAVMALGGAAMSLQRRRS
jgi:ABC-type multidrug transport system ATPase subunit/pSer/pThr/pTyr-binding forkhead associated (FHA) protein